MAGISIMAHRSTLPAVEVGKTDLLSIEQTAQRLAVKPRTLRDWVKRGWLKAPKRYERHFFYERDAVELAASQHPRGSKTQKEST